MKKVLIGIVVFLVLVISALIILPIVYKDKILKAANNAASEKINAKLSIGDIDVSILKNIKQFPDITLVAKDIKIVGIQQFSADTLFQSDEILLALDIKSIFQNEQAMKINAVEVHKAKIKAVVDGNGQANWDIMKPDSTSSKESKPFALTLKHLAFNDVDINYHDLLGNQTLELTGLNHNGKGDFTSNLLDYTSETSIDKCSFFKGIVPYLKNATITNASEITIDQTANKYTLKDNKLKLNDLELVLNGSIQNVEKNKMMLDLNFKSEHNDFKKILSMIPAIYTNDYKSVQASGTFDLKGTVNGLYYNEIYPAMNIALNVMNGSFQYPSLPKKVSNINIKSNITSTGGSLDNMIVDVPSFNMNLGNDPFSGRLKLTQPLSNTYIELYSKGKLNLADIKSFYPMEDVKTLQGIVNLDLNLKARKSDLLAKNYSAIQASGSANISGLHYASTTVEKPVKVDQLNLNFSPQYVDMTQCEGTLGSMDFNMKGKLENFIAYYLSPGEVLKGNVTFSSNKMDMNEFLPKSDETKPHSATEYVLVPKNIDFIGNMDVKQMIYGKMNISNLHGAMVVQNESILLKDVQANLLGGQAKMTAKYNTLGQTIPTSSVTYDIQSFDIGQVFANVESSQKLAPIMKYMSGTLTSTSNLTMSLLPDMSPNLNTLNGDFTAAIPLAKIVNLPILEQIASITKLSQLKNLEATNINTKMSFDNGRVHLPPTQFVANNLNIGLTGSQGLDKSIDYKMSVDVPFAQLGSAGSVVTGLLSKFKMPLLGNVNPETIRLNLNLKGFFDKPLVSLGAPEIVKGGKATNAATSMTDAVKQTGEDLKNKALKTADSVKNALQKQAEDKANELKKQAEDKANELKKKAEEEIKKKKDDVLNELKKKLPW